jgi:hypothetical protein
MAQGGKAKNVVRERLRESDDASLREMLAPTGQTIGGISGLVHGNKCPTVFHSDGTTNFNLSAFLGVFSHASMASPPIYASSTDARNDRGARPLHTGKSRDVILKNKNETNSN